jgi:cell division protein ZapB
MDEQLLQNLEKKINELLTLCDDLYRENAQLKSSQSKWLEERVKLREKNELARSRVDNMISRLKSLEQES